ncbi:SIMPL domain-containing protein [Chelatococcus reniformis]|uniref:SIMPL domain-containing protein n=1 Tax=Chelatococcus reniformis TaxID=1494448 RepID=A0A916TZ99_9HYPH|nr:SIMPL domain-containing protein [Chelatococcus reniformis]GGC46515.1 SIMPL domain-containing protein [Chelatococcus reniformis]
MIRSILTPPLALAGALVAATTAVAQEPAPRENRVVRVEGHASREMVPDMARLSLGVTSRAPKPGDALAANAADAQKVIDIAKRSGIEPRDIQTSAVNLTENMRNKRDAASSSITQEPDGFIATNTVTVRVRDLGKLGSLLTEVVAGGANRINGLSFDVASRDKVVEELRVEAVADARKTANRLAEAAGAGVGRIMVITYPPRGAAPVAEFGMMRAASPRAAVPIEVGALTIAADVETVWSLQQP